MAVGLLSRIDREILPENIDWFLDHAEGAAIGHDADHPGTGQSFNDAHQCLVHSVGWRDLVTNQTTVRAVAFDTTIVENSLSSDAVACEARQAHVREARDNAFLACR